MKRLFDGFIRRLFERRFRKFSYVFTTSDIEISNLTPPSRFRYFGEAKTMLDGKLWKNEIQGMIKTMIDRLALKTLSETERTAYRLAISMLDELNERVIFLASKSLEVEDERGVEELLKTV